MRAFRPLRVALVGCGAVSKLYYAPALRELERSGQLEVAALFDPGPGSLSTLHTTFPGAVAVRDFDELTRMSLDLAIVASPPQFHGAQAIQLLQAGLSVLCEKPMALSVVEGEAMVAAATASQRLLSIGLVRRFLPAARTIQTLLSRNMLGDVESFSFQEGRPFKWPVQSAAYFRDNGVLRDIGVHVLDLLIWWWGQPEDIQYEDDCMGGVELNCRVRLKFARGFTGEVRLSREFHLSNAVVIQCKHGNIRWDIDESNRLQIGLHDSGYRLAGKLHTLTGSDSGLMELGPAAADFQQSFLNQLKNVVAAVRGSEPLRVPGEAGLAGLKAIEKCYDRRTLMNMPWLGGQEVLRARQPGGGLPG